MTRENGRPYCTTIISALRKVRAAYQAGLLTERQAYRWAFRLTRHLPYNCENPQDRAAFRYITKEMTP